MGRHYYSDNTPHIGILDVLALIFIVLKLIGVIDWSWLWVLSPWWGVILLMIVIDFIGWLND